MRKILLITLIVVFHGYKGAMQAFWICFPIIFMINAPTEHRTMFCSEYLILILITGIPVYYLLYGLLIRWLNLIAKKTFPKEV